MSLKALAVSLLSLSDVSTTKRSCYLPGGRSWASRIVLRIETVCSCITFFVLSNSVLSNCSQFFVIVVFFTAVREIKLDVDRAE